MSKVLQLCGASVIIYKHNKVLLQQRKDNGCWAYHGGRIEIGEIVEAAAKRELFEGELIPQQSEVTNLKWFDINHIPENLSPPTKPALKKFVEL